MAKAASRRVYISIGVAVVVIIGLLIAVIVLATRQSNDEEATQGHTQPEVQKPVTLSELFNVKDGIEATLYPTAVDISDVTKAVQDEANVVEIDLVYKSGNFYMKDMQTSVDVIMSTIQASSVGLKIKLDPSNDMQRDIRRVVDKVRTEDVRRPIIITLPVVTTSFDWNAFLSDDIHFGDNVVFNFDLTTECCQMPIGRGVIEHVDLLIRRLESSPSVEITVGSIPSSWDDIRWLLNKQDHVSLIVSSKPPQISDYVYRSLIVRNDIDKHVVFYNVERTIFNEFTNAASTAGSPLLYFDINPRDAGNIIWSHNTDTWEQLNAATKGDVMMIEGDIQVFGQGTANQTDIPIMGHDIGDWNNLTFEQWLDEIIKVDKGMKFDFKTIDGIRPALMVAKDKRDQIKGPIWLNADLLQGPNARVPSILKSEFLEAVKWFEATTLSIGWTTVSKKENYTLKYTMDMVKEMHALTKELKQPITFPVRAEQLKDSLQEFDWLLSQSRDYTVTVWTAHGDNVTKNDMDFVKRQTEAARYYFDLPPELRPTL